MDVPASPLSLGNISPQPLIPVRSTGSRSSLDHPAQQKPPVWVWPTVIGLGAIAVGLVVYSLVSKKKPKQDQNTPTVVYRDPSPPHVVPFPNLPASMPLTARAPLPPPPMAMGGTVPGAGNVPFSDIQPGANSMFVSNPGLKERLDKRYQEPQRDPYSDDRNRPYDEDKNKVIELTQANFHSTLDSMPFAMVAFVSASCGWCKRLMPAYTEAAKQSKVPFCVAEVSKCPDIMKEYQVTGFPTIARFEMGKLVQPLFQQERTVANLLAFANGSTRQEVPSSIN